MLQPNLVLEELSQNLWHILACIYVAARFSIRRVVTKFMAYMSLY